MAKEFTWKKIWKIGEFNTKIYIATQEHGRGYYSRDNHVAARMQVHAEVCIRQNAGKESKWDSSQATGRNGLKRLCTIFIAMKQGSFVRERLFTLVDWGPQEGNCCKERDNESHS